MDSKLMFAGDFIAGPVNRKMNQVLKQVKPDAAFLGGDIAYTNGFAECYCMLDRWLSEWPLIDGRLLPMGFAIGNHDAGVTSYSVSWSRDNLFLQTFFGWQLKNSQSAEFTSTKIGPVTVLALSSGYSDDLL